MGSAPFYIYGALRSGTTLLRLMLDRHPNLANPGEVDFLFDRQRPDPAQPSGWRYDADGLQNDRIFRQHDLDLPLEEDGRAVIEGFYRQWQDRKAGLLTLNIHRHADRLVDLLPEARIVHLIRDPRDVARSTIGMGWAGTLYHGVDGWMRTEADLEAVAGTLPPTRIFLLRYETLCRAPEPTLSELCDFVGVDYDPGMLRFHETSSYAPVDADLTEQWRRKSVPRDIALVEGKAASMMTGRGYQLSGTGLRPGYAERLYLSAKNRLGIWRFGMRRYGSGLFWAEKIARRLNMSRLHARLSTRIERIALSYLK